MNEDQLLRLAAIAFSKAMAAPTGAARQALLAIADELTKIANEMKAEK